MLIMDNNGNLLQLSDKQRRIAEFKKQGMKNKDIAKIEYPNANPNTGAVLVSKQLKKMNVNRQIERGREWALRKHGVTFDLLIGKLVKKLDAEKTDPRTGEVSDDNGTQMNAIKTLLTYIDKDDTNLNGKFTNPPIGVQSSNPELMDAIKNGNDVEIQRILFNKNVVTEDVTKD